MVTKNNICEVIENHFKAKKIKYGVLDCTNDAVIYELFIGSIDSQVMI